MHRQAIEDLLAVQVSQGPPADIVRTSAPRQNLHHASRQLPWAESDEINDFCLTARPEMARVARLSRNPGAETVVTPGQQAAYFAVKRLNLST